MITSANVGAYMIPLGMVRRGDSISGKMYSVDKLKAKKEKKKSVLVMYGEMGMIHVASGDELTEKAISKDLGNGKWEFQKKKGVWRTIKGRRYFFPDDGSDPTPKFHGGE